MNTVELRALLRELRLKKIAHEDWKHHESSRQSGPFLTAYQLEFSIVSGLSSLHQVFITRNCIEFPGQLPLP